MDGWRNNPGTLFLCSFFDRIFCNCEKFYEKISINISKKEKPFSLRGISANIVTAMTVGAGFIPALKG